MKELKLTKKEVLEIKRVLQEIMSYASTGIFYRSGEVLGKMMAENIKRENYFEELRKKLKEEGWVEEIEFKEEIVIAKGSIEVHPSKIASCDILRGIIRGIYENYYKTIIKVEETECESLGDEFCVFNIRRVK